MKKRNQIDDKYKWDLTHIYSNEDELMADIETLKNSVDKFASYKGLLHKPNKCLEFFEYGTEVGKIDEKISVYLLLKLSEDLSNTKYLELESVVSSINKKIACASAFEESELLACGEKYIRKLMKDPRFSLYRLSFDNFLNKNGFKISWLAIKILVKKSLSK